MFLKTGLLLAVGLATQLYAQSTFSPARPPAIPLAVRSPYLSTWLEVGSDGGDGGYLAGEWPTFWTGQVTAWTGIIRVDGLNYVFMGAPAVNAALVNQTAFEYTSTRSTFTQNVNMQVGIVVEFLSPVLPNREKRQSLPFSYMNVEVFSMDGQTHSVELYTDVSGEWLSGDRNDVIQWDYETIAGSNPTNADESAFSDDAADVLAKRAPHTTFGTKTAFQTTLNPRPASTLSSYSWVPPAYIEYAKPGKPKKSGTTLTSATATATATPSATGAALANHHVYRQTQQVFSENSDQALWGDFYYTTANTAGLTYQQGQDVVVRAQFINTGVLADTQDTNYRAINNDWPVFAFSNDLGAVDATAKSTLFTIGFLQEEVIQYENKLNSVEILNGLWTSYFSSNNAAISFFYADYQAVGALCTTQDNKIHDDSVAAAGADYALITTLAVRQVFGALQLANTPGNPYVFLKEISSDGNIQTVDVIFPAMPIFLYLAPEWLGLMLKSLFQNQEAGNWPYMYTEHDLGNHYPNATGHNDGMDEMQPLEECGNMIIMALAYAQRTNDNAFLTKHYDILRQWNEYLIEEALIPANQISTDDFAGALANQTNLAIKGIIGIGAMAEIANRTGNTADGINYTSIAINYQRTWETLAIVPATTTLPAHTSLNYGNDSSYSLLYNLWSDRALNLGLVPQSVYDMQSAFYPHVALTYGVPLDTRHTYTKSDWEMFCAAIAGTGTQDLFVQKIALYINQTPENLAFGDLYDTVTGNYPGFDFIARPVVGGEFAILALNSAPSTPAL